MSIGGSIYTVSTDAARLDLDRLRRWLSDESYWAKGRTLETIRRSIENSCVFGAYDAAGCQVGFARVVTDFATFGWLCDVFVDGGHRGRGVGKLLVKSVVEHPELRDLRIMVLATRDAHELYRRYGAFGGVERPSGWMVRRVETTGG